VRSTVASVLRRCIPAIPPLVVPADCAIGTSGTFPASDSARPATDVPARFEPEQPALRPIPADTIAGDGCVSPMPDRRDGTRIVLARSLGGEEDYRVTGEMYHVRDGEFLRLQCNSGRVVGIVKE